MNNLFKFGDCPFCSASYTIYKEHYETFRQCWVCGGRIKLGEPYVKNDLSYISVLPDLKGESREEDGYVIQNGVLVAAPENVEVVKIPEGTLAIGAEVFANRRYITRVIIPDGVLYIGTMAFCGCERMRDIRLPDSLIAIANCAFLECRCLTTVKIPRGLRAAGYSLFHNCDNLQVADLPQDMDYLGGAPYRYCKNLRRMVIPDCVNDIYVWFTDLFSLTELVLGTQVAECDGIPTERLRSLVFRRTEGWHMNIPGRKDEPVFQKELADPKKAALFLYRLDKKKGRLFIPGAPTRNYSLFRMPPTEG